MAYPLFEIFEPAKIILSHERVSMKKIKWSLPVLFVMLLIVLAGIYHFKTQSNKQSEDSQGSINNYSAVYDRFIKTKAEIFNVQEPIELISSDIFADGGTITFSFRDAAKKKFSVVLPTQDGYVEVSPQVFESTKVMPYNFNGKLLPNYGKEEQALCGLVMRWAKQYPEFWLLLNTNDQSYNNWYAHIHSFSGDEYHKYRGLVFAVVLMRRLKKMANDN